MNLVSWILALSGLLVILIKAVAFHSATVCRQDAWLKASVLVTRSLLSNMPKKEVSLDSRCRIYIIRQGKRASWQRMPLMQSYAFELYPKGHL
jgi:hypothetical protein